MGHDFSVSKGAGFNREAAMAGNAIGMIMLVGSLAGAVLAMIRHLDPKVPSAMDRWVPMPLPPREIDQEPHWLIPLGADGRPNSAAYEIFANYPLAVARQRAMARLGRETVVIHPASGELRLDLDRLTEPWRRMIF